MSFPPNPRGGPESTGVSATLATVLATIAWAALTIFGLGLLAFGGAASAEPTSLVGVWPGIIAMTVAGMVFAWSLRVSLERMRFTACIAIALLATFAYLAALAVAGVVSTGDVVLPFAAIDVSIRGGAALVVGLAAAVAAWCGIALCRTRASAPKWPWEKDDEEDGE